MLECESMRLVAFDVNGTLLADREQFLGALNAVFTHFGHEALPEDELRERFSQPWVELYRSAGIYPSHSAEELYAVYNTAYQAAPAPEAATGAKATLDRLKGAGAMLVVISTQQDSVTRPLLENLRLLSCFNDVIGGVEDKAEVLRGLFERYSIKPAEAAYVGDQDSDMHFARRAGALAVGYTGGIHPAKRLQEAGAQILIGALDDLLDLPIFGVSRST